jgi:simple sugar transport system permease protein
MNGAIARALPPVRTAALAILAAFLAAGFVVAAVGENPVQALRIILAGSLGSVEGMCFTLYYTTNFIFTGLAVAIAFRAGLFNIGVEGQAMIAGVGVALAALSLGDWPGVALPAIALGGAAFGAAWAFVPAWLHAQRGGHVVITTIMFNFLASAALGWLLVEPMRAPASMQPETRNFAKAALIPRFDDLLSLLGAQTTGSPLNASLFVALAAAFAVHVFIMRTRIGYGVRVLGANPLAAEYAGISAPRMIMIAMLLSGALASGLALNEIAGAQGRLILEFTGGYGFVGIAVALMGRNHPLGVIFAALLFGALYQGGAELAFDMPKITRDTVMLVQGVVVLMVGYFGSTRLRARGK